MDVWGRSIGFLAVVFVERLFFVFVFLEASGVNRCIFCVSGCLTMALSTCVEKSIAGESRLHFNSKLVIFSAESRLGTSIVLA